MSLRLLVVTKYQSSDHLEFHKSIVNIDLNARTETKILNGPTQSSSVPGYAHKKGAEKIDYFIPRMQLAQNEVHFDF